MRKVPYTKQELCDAIYAFVAARPEDSFTRAEISAGIGRVKSPHILRMIEHLVSSGWLLKGDFMMPNGVAAFTYKVSVKEPVGVCEELQTA